MRATKERPPQESLDGGGVPCLRGRRPQLRSLSQPLRPVPGSRSGQNGLPSPLRAARPGRSHSERVSSAVEGARRAGGQPLPGRNSAMGRGEDSKGRPRTDEPSYIAPGRRAAPARATFSPCPLTPACALPETHARTYARPSLAPSPCGPPLRTRAGECCGHVGAETGAKDLNLKPGREGPGAGPERARPRARTLWPPDRVRGGTSTPRERRCLVTAQAQHGG
ncbi:uncharacterized protein LOC120885071 [Ictidomys tridecemlineatus]